MIYKTTSAAETEAVGFALAKQLKKGDIVKMYGDLGAGKTAFVRGLARGLSYDGIVQSPTFSLCNVYEGAATLYHFDLYRLRGPEDLEGIGFFDYLEEDAVFAIEWCERAEDVLPDTCHTVRIAHVDENTREICVVMG